MNLLEVSVPPPAAYPVRALADHLRLGTGFADDGSQDALLEAYLHAAMAAVEARTGKALLERSFEWELHRWANGERQGLPLAPVVSIDEVALIQADGAVVPIDPQAFRLAKDQHRPLLVALTALPTIPTRGSARIRFTAGFGPDWADVPADLEQAVLLLAAHYYENRNLVDGSGGAMPFGVSTLMERYRPVRLGGEVL